MGEEDSTSATEDAHEEQEELAPASSKTPTIADVARLAGVSIATASRTLNRTRPVAAHLQSQVLAAARELGYAPNPHARALARAHDTTIGVIVHDVSDPYFSEIVRGILQATSDAGQMVLIANTYRDRERELAYMASFRARRTGALIIAGSGMEDRDFGALMTRQILDFEAAGGRTALIGRHYAPGDVVMADNLGGARALAEHLVQLGHRTIGVIAGPERLTATHDRLAGFRGVLEEAGIALPEQHIIAGGDFTREAGASGATTLLDRVPGLTAIFALNDVMAIGALSILRSRGLRIPEDVSLCGFDDIPLAPDLWPPLTTVRVPMVEMGAQALALARLPKGSEIRVVHLSTRLVVRESTAAPRSR
ncbi:LacI family DNA-binding transcriptional regulator [Pendulispora albinea]|uniref:LacI family transcriptional regulator n=1 Tax=Pendulispora albinea TaxID=2741071 RepID=A0ABZ2M8W1_9BACT